MISLAQFMGRCLHDERVVEESRRLAAAEEACEQDLSAGGAKEIVAANDCRNALGQVVDRRGELVAPVAPAVTNNEVPTLLIGTLLLGPPKEIVEAFDGRIEAQSNT